MEVVSHVVVCPNSAPGHTTPFLHFVRRLAAAGVVTTIVSSDRHVVELQSLLGSLHGAPVRLLGLRDKNAHLSNREWRKLLKDSAFELSVIQMLQELVTDIASPDSLLLRGLPPATPPVCIIYDTFNLWAQTAAVQLRIQSHLLWVSPACSLAFSLEAPRLFQDGRLPLTKATRDMIVSDIPGLPPTRAMDFPSPLLETSACLSSIQSRYRHIGQADVIVVNTCNALEKPVLDALVRKEGLQAKHMLEIGPLLPESYLNDGGVSVDAEQGSKETDPCISWLNTQALKSVLYISFGSYATHSGPQLLDMALGLEASGSGFLWMVKPPDAGETSAASGTPVSVTEFLPPGFEERVKGRGMCYSGWAPQMRILKHPAVGGFLSHCGWNSTLETVCAGVPVLAWPLNAEQHIIRRTLVETLKVAIELKGNAYTTEELEGDVLRPAEFVSREEIARKARSLMQEAEGQSVRENIQKLKAECWEAVAVGGSSRRSLEAYVRLLHASSVTRVQDVASVRECKRGADNDASDAQKMLMSKLQSPSAAEKKK